MTEQIEDQFWAAGQPRTELERLSRQVAELQNLLTQAERDAARVLRERDIMRERVSEPYGCTHCGEAKRSHGRQYVIGAGMHSWERPSDEQVKTRMLARRAARQPLETEQPAHGKLWQLLEWSFWGAGMGDVFRMPLADTMLAAVPAETVAQAEQIMAEFIERRNIEKTGVTVWQEQRDELAAFRALELGDPDGRVSASCSDPEHPTWLRKPDDTRGCPWCRVAELEAERAKYVGVEPTIAEEMAYLSRCLDAVHEACDRAVRQATRWEHPLPIPEWVESVRQAADGATEPLGTRPALPWAHVMDDHDLGMFLDDLVSAAMGRWQSEPEVPDRQVLAAVEKACADWRTPGQGLRGDEPGAAS